MPFTMTRTHGNAVVAERLAGDGHLEPVDGLAWTDIVGFARGPGKVFRLMVPSLRVRGPSGLDWFHVPIPTPAVLNDRRLFLDNLFLFFTSDSPQTGQRGIAFVNSLHLFDGSARIFVLDDISKEFSGDWSGPKTIETSSGRLSNTFFPRTRSGSTTRFAINTGLGISVGTAAEIASANITFHSAGATWADFQVG